MTPSHPSSETDEPAQGPEFDPQGLEDAIPTSRLPIHEFAKPGLPIPRQEPKSSRQDEMPTTKLQRPSIGPRRPTDSEVMVVAGPGISSSLDLLVGQDFGAYRVLDLISRGSMGAVYRAEHRELKTEFALKVMLNLAPSEEERGRFRREARTLARLNHPHLVRVTDLGTEKGVPFYVMELIEGRSLESYFPGGPPRDQLFKALSSVAEALAYCHEHGVIHRDVKPGNIMIERETNRAVLIDFGLLRKTRHAEDGSTTSASGLSSASDEMIGTPLYMSPEQIDQLDRFGEVGPASDVWGLGATMAHAILGAPLFFDPSVFTVFQHILNAGIPRLSERRPETEEWLDTLVERCLQRQPSRRPAMREVAELLRARTKKRRRRRPGAARADPEPDHLWIIVGLVVFAIVAFLGIPLLFLLA